MDIKVRRVDGLYNTLAPFFIMSGNQESISKGDHISVECYHTKVYTVTTPVKFILNDGYQAGQLKKITLVHKGNTDANVTIDCISLPRELSKIEMVNVGDTVTLMFTGGIWIILETINIMNVSLRSPIVS